MAFKPTGLVILFIALATTFTAAIAADDEFDAEYCNELYEKMKESSAPLLTDVECSDKSDGGEKCDAKVAPKSSEENINEGTDVANAAVCRFLGNWPEEE